MVIVIIINGRHCYENTDCDFYFCLLLNLLTAWSIVIVIIIRHCYENTDCPKGYACDSGGQCKQVAQGLGTNCKAAAIGRFISPLHQ